VAETKARASSTSSTRSRPKTKTRKATKARQSNGAKPAARSGSSQATKSRSSGSKRTGQRKATSKKAASKNGAGQVESARHAVEGTAKQAGHSIGEAGRSVGRAARKARTPLLAGSAALAGAAGGIALGARAGHKTGKLAMPHRPKIKVGPKIKVNSRDLAKATKDVGEFGVQVGQLASELRRTRESAKANGTKHRSPIEVVLQSLTSRGDNA
jgi:hypothetical protein